MTWNKKMTEKLRKSRMKAGLFFGFCIFLGLSLYSYDPQDPSAFNFSGLSLKINNFCGIIGASLSEGLYQAFGASSWLILLGILLLCYRLLIRPFNESLLPFLASFLVFMLSVSSLAELHLSKLSFFNGEVSLGGAFGKSFIALLSPLFSVVGTAVILWSAFFLFILFYSQWLFFPALVYGPKKLLLFVAKGKNWRWLGAVLLKLKSAFWIVIAFLNLQGKRLARLLAGGKKLVFKAFSKSSGSAVGLSGQPGLSPENPSGEQAQDHTRDYTGDQARYSGDYARESTGEPNPSAEAMPSALHKKPASDRSFFKLAQKKSLSPEGSPSSNQKKGEGSAGQAGLISQSGSNGSRDSVQQNKMSQFFDRVKQGFSLPSVSLLLDPPALSKKISVQDVENLSKTLIDKLHQFSIQGEIKAIKTGPALVLFEFKPEDHVKVSQIKKMESDLSLALSSESVRIIAPIPGRDVVGIEASMPYRETVYLKNLLKEESFFKAEIPLVLGRRADNKIGVKDLARIPHLLVAGTTGSGKSMFIISFICSLLFRHKPDSLRLLLIDPKQVDMSFFKDIPHLLAPIITSSQKAVRSLHWAIQEMEKRYRSLSEFKARDHKSFNQSVKKLSVKEREGHELKNQELEPHQQYYFEPLPLICIVIEEFGDLMADLSIRRTIENAVVRLAQKARASGIHLLLAMQSPRKDVVTGLIKTNIPGRISFKVASGMDSRVILDDMGAERLLSHGDMLFLEPGSLKATRYHGPLVRDKELLALVQYWKDQAEPSYEEALLSEKPSSLQDKNLEGGLSKSDPMYGEILDFVKSCEVISTSLLQRKFQIGYPRAGRIIQTLYEQGQIGPPKGSKPREVLINK